MWKPAVSGMEKAHNCADLSYRRIRRYSVWRLKRLEACDFSHVRFTKNGGLSENSWITSGIRQQEYESYYADNGSLLFIGILLGSLFLMGTAMIIYYKQISEGYEDQKRFEIMQKVGLSRREVRSSVRRQILMVFFLPLLMAMLHITMAFPMIRRMLLLFGMTNTKLFIGCTAGTVLIFAVVYGLIYLMTARSYYHIVERK